MINAAIDSSDSVSRWLNLAWRARRKYGAQRQFWEEQLCRLLRWDHDTEEDWWGMSPPSAAQKREVSQNRALNDVVTVYYLRPAYLEQVRLPGKVAR